VRRGQFHATDAQNQKLAIGSGLIVPYPQSPKRTCLASMFAVSENSERADVRNATSRNDWRCLNGWSDC